MKPQPHTYSLVLVIQNTSISKQVIMIHFENIHKNRINTENITIILFAYNNNLFQIVT